MTIDKPKLKAVYVVAEESCIHPGSGAYQHIHIGIEELQKHFGVYPIFPALKSTANFSKSKDESNGLTIKASTLAGGFRDLKQLGIRSAVAWKNLKQIYSVAPDFVYFRACFLDPLPLLLRFAGIPCFVEANGLQFEGRKKYYKSCLSPLNRMLEKWIYRLATHVFFVGSYGAYWKLPCTRWTNVENGIEQ